MKVEIENKIARYPSVGHLLVVSDLQGNFDDFQIIEALFKEKESETGSAYLLFLGDLIHGHHDYTRDNWPEWLGNYYEDKSIEIIENLLGLQEEFPGKVISLLGNHEHSQIGGIWLDGYSDHFETCADSKLEFFKNIMMQFPLVALTPCGVAFTHACPSLSRSYTSEEIGNTKYNGDYQKKTISAMLEYEPLGPLVWSRVASKEETEDFLLGLSEDNQKYNVSVCGHDPVENGYDKAEINQMVLSTSYRMQDCNKTYLFLDLSAEYKNTDDFIVGKELLPLYP